MSKYHNPKKPGKLFPTRKAAVTTEVAVKPTPKPKKPKED